MSTQKKAKPSRARQRTSKAARRRLRTITVDVPVSPRRTDVITEKIYVTTEPEVEIRKPATLAQALTEPVIAVVRPRSRVRKQVIIRRSRSRA